MSTSGQMLKTQALIPKPTLKDTVNVSMTSVIWLALLVDTIRCNQRSLQPSDHTQCYFGLAFSTIVQKLPALSALPMLNMTVCGVGSGFSAPPSMARVRFMQTIFGFFSCTAQGKFQPVLMRLANCPRRPFLGFSRTSLSAGI